uniref:DUF835 domain-containing protein n=1 Tax=Loa loa TaxID=7209 RepID=A0A1I7W322_LOALO
MEGNITSVYMAMGLMEEAVQSDQVTALIDETGFSSLSKLIRMMLYVLRFLAKVSKEKISCIMWVATPFEQPDFPPYPAARVVETRSFETVGLNLFGLVLIKEDHANVKRRVALFTCSVTRAVHLEVMGTMSAEQFVQAFRRFIS